MACDFCEIIPRSVVAELNDDLREGEVSLKDLAAKYDASVEAIETHERDCLYTDNDGYDELDRMIRQLDIAASRSMRNYRDNTKNFEAMDHYIALTKEKRAAIVAKERLRPSNELMKEIATKVLSPLIKRVVVVNTEEIERLRTALFSIVDPKLNKKIDRALKDSLRNSGRRLSQECSSLLPILQKILNVQESPVSELDLNDDSSGPDQEDADPTIN